MKRKKQSKKKKRVTKKKTKVQKIPKEESLIHVRLDAEEAIQSRKDVLTAQADSIKIVQTIQRYKELRLKELVLKIALQKKIKESKMSLNDFKKLLPTIKIPELVKGHEDKIKEEVKKEKERIIKKTKKSLSKKKVVLKKSIKKATPKIIVKKTNTLENELKAIQAKLAQLG